MKNAITEAYDDGSLEILPHIARDRTALDLLLACASKTDWHSYVKPPFGGPEQVLGYLAAYTHRVAISNQRIIAFDGQRVTFQYRDYHDGNARKSMEIPAAEFLRRSFCTSSRSASPASATTASSPIATGPPTSKRRALSSAPHAPSLHALLLPIRVAVLNAAGA